MQSLQERADHAAELMRTKRLRAPAAAARVIRSEGITYPPDVTRIKRDILVELNRRSQMAKKARKKAKVETPSVYPTQRQLELKF